MKRCFGFFLSLVVSAGLVLGLSSCTRLLGWGVLLWSTDDPSIPSGTVLPVYIRSNIDQVWVVGIPEAYQPAGSAMDKIEIPLAQLELSGSKKDAEKSAAAFAAYALTYAETLQDGLPIRQDPDNSSQRVYRLKLGQVIKVLSEVTGNAAISTTGAPLPGAWYRVLTDDGVQGYCFSYRLRFFEYAGGGLSEEIAANASSPSAAEDAELEDLLSKDWYPELYGDMVSSGRIDLNALSQGWAFLPGRDSGLARIYTDGIDKTFAYTGISAGSAVSGSQYRLWRFDGASLQMSLRSETTLALQYLEDSGGTKTLVFVTLSQPLDDIMLQESERRKALFTNLYNAGPVFSSSNYGSLSFSADGRFVWSGYSLLIPQVIPATALGRGSIDMGYYLDAGLQSRFAGAFGMNFEGIGGKSSTALFMYTMENGLSPGIRIEFVPPDNVEGLTVLRRASTPTVIYFSRDAEASDAVLAP
jgi:hypothetical protein